MSIKNTSYSVHLALIQTVFLLETMASRESEAHAPVEGHYVGESDREAASSQNSSLHQRSLSNPDSSQSSDLKPSAVSQIEQNSSSPTTQSLPNATDEGERSSAACRSQRLQRSPVPSDGANRTISGNPVKSLATQERENFLLFVKILFKILEEAREPETRARAQRIVLECRRRSQLGDPNFIPLMEATQQRLRLFVGENKWQRAHLFLHHYKSKQMTAGANHPTALSASRPMGVH